MTTMRSDLLDVVAVAQRVARDAEVDLLVGVVEFCVGHPPVDGADRCRVKVHESVDGRPVLEPLTGEGVPEVSAWAVAQLGATLGLSPGSVQRLVGEALELAYRLPGLYAQVEEGRVPVWQARRVAKATAGLTESAARFVDRHLHGLTGHIPVTSLDRLVAEAIARHDHARERQRIARRTDRRHLDVEMSQCDLLGQVPVTGLLDLPDAIALDAAIGHAAERLAEWGSTDGRDARRARAAGDLAREHLALAGRPQPSGVAVYDDQTGTLTPIAPQRSQETPGGVADGASRAQRGVPRAARREVVLHVHITDRELLATLRGADQRGSGRARPLLGRVEHAAVGDLPIRSETIREWCGATGTSVRVLPTLDLEGQIHHDAYEIPDRLREQVVGRDHTCVFPGCRTHARACDIDHIVPYDHAQPARGGPTATENLAPLCRRHHNLKTAGRISYEMTAPGSYVWDLGTGQSYVRDHQGTRTAGADLLDGDPPEP
jgi:hypothetical protein